MGRVKWTRVKDLEAQLRGGDGKMQQVATDWEMDKDVERIIAEQRLEMIAQVVKEILCAYGRPAVKGSEDTDELLRREMRRLDRQTKARRKRTKKE